MSSSIGIDDTWDELTTCRKYGSNKSWHTRYIKKVTQLHQLLEKTFNRAMNEDLNINLQKEEGEVAILHELADFMVQKKFPKAKEHTGEVVALETEIMECWALVTANAHKRAVLGATRAAAAPPPINRPHPYQDGGGNVKLIGELKPESLTHDSSAGDQLELLFSLCNYAGFMSSRPIYETALTETLVCSLTAAFRPPLLRWEQA